MTDNLRDRVLALAQSCSNDPCQYAREANLALAVAALAVAHEREACAQIVETHSIGRRDAIAAAIRARGNTL